ncbi:Relaxase [Pseudomonas chlororaphis subsp. aureofaciens]|nr:Relaxase [Pseudomonas chlororaphis subsp. aureofaciens]
MLIRVRGGGAGVFAYLRDGKKSGRNYTRDQLDERVVMAGCMGLAESVVSSMGNRGEKYLHITLGFKEDYLPLDTLRAITEEFERFCMTAYRPDEYVFYAEAHLPRVKTYTNKRTGQEIIRKPHIHVVIPELNLFTQKPMNPLGKVDHQTKYLEAFQEYINAKYGLASPKDNRRVGITNGCKLIARQTGDYFEGIGGELKAQLLKAIIERNVLNFSELQRLASEFGAVRVRNEGKPNAYLNVRPEGTKGVNLKEYVFSQDFVVLPSSEKARRIATELARKEAGSLEYIESNVPRPSPGEITTCLDEWHQVRARELKYINSGSRKFYAGYRIAGSAEKQVLLDEREAAFYQKHDTGQHVDVEMFDMQRQARLPSLAIGPSDEVEVNDSRCRGPESVIEQLLIEHQKVVDEDRLASSDEHKTIKLNLDATRLLAHLSHTHGVLPDKYPIKRGLGGGDRMQCGSRNLNVSDFLTKELHLPWPEAAAILRDVYEQQIASASVMPRARISSSLWASYRQTWPARTQAREADWASQMADEVKRRAHIKSVYLLDRQLIKADLDKKPSERKAAYSLASMHKVMADARLYCEIALERQVLREKHRAPGHDGYKRFLVVLANDWNTSALTELRRLASPGKSRPSSNGFGAEQELMASMPALLPAVHFTVNQRGDVTYYADHEKALAILLDGGQFVEVLDESARSVEAGLRLAVQKFGSALDIHGTPEFRSQVLDVVLKSGLRVTFKDPALANELAQMKARAASIDEEEAGYSRKTEQQLEAEYAGEAFDDDRRRWKERSLNTAEQEAPSPVRPGHSRTFSPSP